MDEAVSAMDAGGRPCRPGLLLPPTYAATVAAGRRPSLREVGAEWLDAVAFWRDRTRLLPAVYFAQNVATFAALAVLLTRHFSVGRLVAVLGVASLIGTVYNTVWFHRYCSHRAFTFRRPWFARLFLWTNPAFFREESYVIPHRLHHSRSDGPNDPYGPHLGWLGSYLAIESSAKTNPRLNAADYERLAKSLEHIGFVRNTHAQFQRTGSVEHVGHYAARMAVATALWGGLAYALAQGTGVLVWFAGVGLYTFLVRDFNYRGHGGLFGEHPEGTPLNHLFYGFIAGEWHENHHHHPRLARSGFVWWQLDVPWWIIRLLSLCGLVSRYATLDAAGEAPRRRA